MDLTTKYLGMTLKNPIVCSASPLSRELKIVREMEDFGVAAVVMESIFEEQMIHKAEELDHFLVHGKDTFAEALTYFPIHERYMTGPERYLEHIRKLKDATDIPVIGSLNGVSKGGWIRYAKMIEEAGADALELNIYYLATDPDTNSNEIEQMYLDTLAAVKGAVNFPVALKIGPFFSAMTWMAKRLSAAGADALVLFNRFYQPDMDLEKLQVVPNVLLSTPQAMRLPLHWISILYGQIEADLAATGGVHSAEDVLKMLMAGANVTMMTSALLKNGVSHIAKVLEDMRLWMEKNDYESVQQMQGVMSQRRCAEPAAFERANYMRAIKSYA